MISYAEKEWQRELISECEVKCQGCFQLPPSFLPPLLQSYKCVAEGRCNFVAVAKHGGRRQQMISSVNERGVK